MKKNSIRHSLEIIISILIDQKYNGKCCGSIVSNKYCRRIFNL